MLGWDRLVDSTASKMPLLPAGQEPLRLGDASWAASMLQVRLRMHHVAGELQQAHKSCCTHTWRHARIVQRLRGLDDLHSHGGAIPAAAIHLHTNMDGRARLANASTADQQPCVP